MVKITFAELTLFLAYLTDLQRFTAKETDHKFYNRWQEQIVSITEIANRLDNYLSTKNAELARQVEASKRTRSFRTDEFTIFEPHINYYRAGIDSYKRDVESELISNGLMEKPILEMTGLEFRTLLLLTMAEHTERIKQ